jgi:hypothetical protein
MGLGTEHGNNDTNETAILTRNEQWRLTPTQRKLRTPLTPSPSQCGARSACSRPDSPPHNSAVFSRSRPPPSHSILRNPRTGSLRSSIRPIVQQARTVVSIGRFCVAGMSLNSSIRTCFPLWRGWESHLSHAGRLRMLILHSVMAGKRRAVFGTGGRWGTGSKHRWDDGFGLKG